MTVAHPLDNAVYTSLTGPHAHLAERHGKAARYPVDVSPFVALPTRPVADDWRELADLAGPGAVIVLAGLGVPPPPDWEIVAGIPGVQMIDDGVATTADAQAVRLTPTDVPQMLDLVGRTQPGPFLPRTIALGTYLGLRRNGDLIAMAGERLHPPGWTEISAVCTDAAYRGQGLATRLVHAVADGIRRRGETPFLHAAASNTTAIRLYESLGFRLRDTPTFQALRVPGPVVDRSGGLP